MTPETISAVADLMEANARLLRAMVAQQQPAPIRVRPAMPAPLARLPMQPDAGPVVPELAPAPAPKKREPIVKAAKPAIPGFRGYGDVTIQGMTFRTTGRFAALLKSLEAGPKTGQELVDEGHGKTTDCMRPLMSRLSKIVQEATRGEWAVHSVGTGHLGALGKTPGRYQLVRIGNEPKPEPVADPVDPVAPPMPDPPQDKPPEDAVDTIVDTIVDTVMDAFAPTRERTPEPDPEPVPHVETPAPVQDEPKLAPAQTPAVAKKVFTQPLPKPAPLSKVILGDRLAFADLDAGIVHTAQGTYNLEGAARIGRTINYLCKGEMFDLRQITNKCGWRDPETARTAMLMEQRRLAPFGLEFYVDKFNARLRRIGA